MIDLKTLLQDKEEKLDSVYCGPRKIPDEILKMTKEEKQKLIDEFEAYRAEQLKKRKEQ